MSIRTTVLVMLDTWNRVHERYPVECINADASTLFALRDRLVDLSTVSDVQQWVTDADIAGLWSHSEEFERAYCSLVDIAESDPQYIRPDVSC